MVYPGASAQGQPGQGYGPPAAPQARPIQARGKGDEAPTPQGMPRPEQLGVVPARSEAHGLEMPRPEQLGVSLPRPEQLADPRPAPPALPPGAGGVDWKATRARLDELRATSFALSHAADGYHFVILLATGKPNEAYHVEVQAATEQEAVELGLKRATETCR